jgi:tetratricopeptide (TPR) repeat protein
VALARAGTAAIESRRFGDALEAFTKAADMQPADASLCFGAGVAAFMLGQDDVAQARFECALVRDPDFLPASIWLGDVHYRAGRVAEAITTYEAAERRSPLPREQQRQLDRWRREQAVQSRFHETRTEHFIARYHRAADEDDAFARDVVERLEAVYRRIGGTLGVYPSRPMTVVLYTRKQYDDVTRLADWSAAAYDGRIRLPIAGALKQPGELDRVLSHEFVHAVVAAVGGRTVPAWVSEGLATVLEPAGSQDVDVTLTRTGRRPALSTLHRGFVGLSKREAEMAYATAAQAMRRLIDQRGTASVVALLEDLAGGASFDCAFEQRFAMRYEDFAAGAAR